MLYHTYDQEVGFPHSSVGKESARSAGDPGSIPRSGRSPGEGNGNPLQHPCLENPVDRGAWWVTVNGFLLLLIFFNWRIIVLQCCVGFCHISMNHL